MSDEVNLMSIDEVPLTTNRRRQRTRRKRPTVIDIIPGRNPVGFRPPSPVRRQHVSPGVAIRASEWTEAKSEHSPPNPDPIPDSPQSRLSISTPAPTFDNTNTSITVSPYSEILESPRYASLFQPNHTTHSSNSRPPARRKSGEGTSGHFLSPLKGRDRRSVSTMTGRMYIKPEDRYPLVVSRAASASTAAMLHGGSRDLNSLDDLASSRPIPLSALCGRANSRNKGSKSWKSIPLDVDGDTTSDPVSNAILSEVSQYKPRSRLSAMHQSNNEDGYYQRDNGTVRLQGPYDRLRHRSDPMGQSWSREMNAQIQQNPLSYSAGYDSPYHNSHSQRNSYISESPFIRGENYFQSGQTSWSTESYHPFSGVLGGAMQQPEGYAQGVYTANLISDPSLHTYGTEFGRPYTSSSHESLAYQVHGHHDQMSFYQPSHMLQYSMPGLQHEQYIGYEPSIQAEDAYPAYSDGVVLATASNPIEVSSQTQTAKTSPIPPSGLAYDSDNKTGAKLNQFDVAEPHSETKKCGSKEEVAAYLNDVVHKAQMDTKQTTLHDPFVETKAPLVCEHQEQDYKTNHSLYLQTKSEDQIIKKSVKELLARKRDSPNETFRRLCQAASIEKSVLKKSDAQEQINEKRADPFESRAGNLSTASGKILKPPPGLPKPAAHNMMIESSPIEQRSLLEKHRLEEANSWFSKDGRGEEQLRQHVAEVAQGYSEKCKKLQGTSHSVQDSVTAKQMTLLLGNVIANLHSYVSGNRTEQTSNFADFGTVKPRSREPSHGGRRSYFDRDPAVNQWRLPSGRAFSSLSNNSDKKLPLSRLHRSYDE